MPMLFVSAFVLCAAAWAARMWVVAQRAEHLVVLRLENDTFLLVRQPEGRYLLVSSVQVPAELARYQVQVIAERFRAVRAARAAKVRPIRLRRAVAPLH